MDFEHGPFEESLRVYIGVVFAGVFLFTCLYHLLLDVDVFNACQIVVLMSECHTAA